MVCKKKLYVITTSPLFLKQKKLNVLGIQKFYCFWVALIAPGKAHSSNYERTPLKNNWDFLLYPQDTNINRSNTNSLALLQPGKVLLKKFAIKPYVPLSWSGEYRLLYISQKILQKKKASYVRKVLEGFADYVKTL